MAEELDNELENQDISTEEFDDDVESDPEEDRLYNMSDEELEKEFIKALNPISGLRFFRLNRNGFSIILDRQCA